MFEPVAQDVRAVDYQESDMSAATFTREAIVGPAPRVSTTGGQWPQRGRVRPASARVGPIRTSSARACALPGVGTSVGLSDRSLLAIMVGVVLVFLFGFVIMVQGFWVASQAPEVPAQQRAVVTLG